MKFTYSLLIVLAIISCCFAAPNCETYDECILCENHVFLNGQCKEQKCLDQSGKLKETTLKSKIENKNDGFDIEVYIQNNILTTNCFEDKLIDQNKKLVNFESDLSEFYFKITKNELNTLCSQTENQDHHVYDCKFSYELYLAKQLQTTFNIRVTVKIEKLTNTVLDLTIEALQKDHQISAEPIVPTSTAIVKKDKTYSADRESVAYKLGDQMYIQLQLDDVFLQSNYNVEYVKAVLVTPELDYIPLNPIHTASAAGGKLNLQFQAQWVRDEIIMLITGKLVAIEKSNVRRFLADQQQYKDMTQAVSFSVSENSTPSEQPTDSSISSSTSQQLAASIAAILFATFTLI